MKTYETPFLTAEWRHVAMLNFEIDPSVLQPLVPAGTELDDWEGRTFLSIVAFHFLNTRVRSMVIPFHRNFEEVNLRFYVRRKVNGDWRRAVVFVKEFVPRFAIALTARTLYGENYVAVRMRHHIEQDSGGAARPQAVSYSWWVRGRENRMELSADGEFHGATPGSEVEFITEHYWGYARRRDGRTTEYRVEHPPWRVCAATPSNFDCDVADVYGKQFVEFLKVPPASAFLASGSKVVVFTSKLLSS
jgi:uncharacterized protein YqjF (DUF2071 family)